MLKLDVIAEKWRFGIKECCTWPALTSPFIATNRSICKGMNSDLWAEAIDDPQIPEFASWRSYRKFEERVIRYRRHIWDREIGAFLDTVMCTRQNRDAEITIGTVLWRAQLGVDYVPFRDASGEEVADEPKGFSGARMQPVAEYAREGRANSSGIPVLYLASKERTAISEVRPWVGSEVSVAQFRVTRQLNAIDLTQGHGKSSWSGLTLNQLWGKEEVDAEGKARAVWTDVDNAFSRPITPSDERESYISTRILAELFQEAGYDAIVYRSQFGQDGQDGYNIVIFKLEDAEILNCAPYKVETIEVNFKEFGNRWFARLTSSQDDENG